MNDDGFQLALQSVALNHNASAAGVDNNDDIVTGYVMTLVSLHFIINGYFDSQESEIDNLLKYPEIELADVDTLRSVDSFINTTYTKESWDAFFVTTNARNQIRFCSKEQRFTMGQFIEVVFSMIRQWIF